MDLDLHDVVEKPNKRRIMGIVTGLLISLPLFGALFFSGNAFFTRASNEAPRDVVVSDITKSEVVVLWTTDHNSQGVIEYGVSPTELIAYAPEPKASKDHSVNITLLTPATTYYFQIRIGNEVYDNGGVPWSFTTRTLTGDEPVKEVKGVSTIISGIPDPPDEVSISATLDPDLCKSELDCGKIKASLGRGCVSSDYIRCLSKNGTVAPTGSYSTTYSTPFPTPSSILIRSNLCKIDYLQDDGTCTTWTWDNFDTKTQTCRDAFDRYVLQCKNKSFENNTNTTDPTLWYFNQAISNIATNSATFKTVPTNDTTVYCQLRAEDEVGGEAHATNWVRASKKCE